MNMNKVKNALIGIAVAAGAAIPLVASAATTIAIDSVTQRWPWNNKVDITYTISGGQDLAGGNYQKIVFTTVINGTTYTMDGTTDVGASANAGTHTVTWTLPEGVRSTNCTMSAAVYASDAPSGDDYMVIDLTKTSDNVTYEGLLATQDASNGRYNTATYKTDKLVLRKVPAGGPYPTGDSAKYASANASKTWTTDRDYYIGVFPVTQYQYQKLYGSNPSERTGATTGTNVTEHRPVEKVSWFDLRSPYNDNSTDFAPTSSIPAVASNSGTFFQRLNYITGNKFGFDLPTEVMFEIAERAGATTTYYWGNTMVTNYVVCTENNGGNTVAVGSRLPNSWGLYDMAGNVWEWCLDYSTASHNLVDIADPFAPLSTSAVWRRVRGGGSWRDASSGTYFHASYRYGMTASNRYNYLGFRVSRITD